jgi:hypothetical protein
MFPAFHAPRIRTVQMARLLAFFALGTALAGCSGYSIPSMDMSMFKSSPATVTVRTESNPSGAEARSAGGTSCRTPCVLALPASGVSNVTFSLQGYQPQTIAVNVTSVRESLDLPDTGMAEQIRIDPNPVFAALEPTPPPAPPARKRAPAKPKPKPQPAAAAAPPPPPQQQPVQQGWGPPQQQQPGFR